MTEKHDKCNKRVKNINDKRLYKYLQLNIKDVYPFFKQKLLHKAIDFAKEHVIITRKDVEVTFQAQKSVLYNE